MRIFDGEHQLHLTGVTVRIFNPIELRALDGLQSLVSKIIEDVGETDDAIIMDFGGPTLSVDIRDAAYEGPEAMIVSFDGGPFLVL